MNPSDIFAAVRWWFAITAIGATALPLAYRLFAGLPDRGYAFTKMLGLVGVTYIFWLLTSFGLLSNTLGGIIGAFVIFGGASFYLYSLTDRQLWGWIRENLSYILTAELIFALLFAVWTIVRAQNPSITATEKPMEFAFLNAATFSPTYPPLDPWLSGFAISYYYKGYVMVSIVNRLAGVMPAVGFNLGVAWLVGGAGIGAFGVVSNLVTLINKENIRRSMQGPTRLAVTLGLIAAIALPLAGNNQMLVEILHGNQIGSADLWSWVNIRDVNGQPNESPRFLTSEGAPSSGWWWWRSSRLIHEHHLSGRAETGLEPIAEFPGFSFVLGDMHPHVLTLPYVFLIIGLALVWYLREPGTREQPARRDGDDQLAVTDDQLSTADGEPHTENGATLFTWAKSIFENIGAELLLISALLLGGLAFTNTWDLPIHLFVVLGAYLLSRWRQEGEWRSDFLAEFVLLGLFFVVAILVLFYPFFAGLSSQAGAPYILPMLMRPTRVIHFLTIFGMPLTPIVLLLGALLFDFKKKQGKNDSSRRQPFVAGLSMALGFPLFLIVVTLLLTLAIATSEFGGGYFAGLIGELGLALPPRGPGADFAFGSAFLSQLLPIYFAQRFRYIWLTLFLGLLLGGVVTVWQLMLNRSEEEEKEVADASSTTNLSVIPFVLLMVFTALLLSIGPEYLYLKDNFGQRLNTIFKFYYQAWILFGTAGLIAIGYLLQQKRPVGLAAATIYGLLFIFAVQFPLRGVQSRTVENRGGIDSPNRPPATLDGLLFMERFYPDDRQAVDWILVNTEPGAIILETTGNPYSYYARVSANTGRPTPLGWANHESQWRGDSTDQYIVRGGQIREIYDTTNWDQAAGLLNQLEVNYIYVGNLEAQDHNPIGLQKFADNLEIAYQNGSVTIYLWQ